jgi:hypothetical protein
MTQPSPPTPEQIDALAEEYLALEKIAEEAKEAAKIAAKPCQEKADELKALVLEYGQIHAKKSKLLVGVHFELMSTSGTTTETDQAMVEKLRLAMSKKSLGGWFKKMFEEVTEYRKRPSASEVIRSGKLPPTIIAIFARCFVEKEKNPSLDVRPRKVESAA